MNVEEYIVTRVNALMHTQDAVIVKRLEGGMSNGEDIVLKAVMKPIPTLMQPLHSVDVESRTEVLACKERSDTCAVSAASVVGEAMTSFVMAQALCEKFGSDAMVDVLAAFEAYGKRVRDDW